MNAARTAGLICALLVGGAGCTSDAHALDWEATGSSAAFPAPLAVQDATAITIDAPYIYWITSDAFLYRAPRSGGGVDRVTLPAPGMLLGAHNDVFVGWTESGGGSAAIAAIDPPTGKLTIVNRGPGPLRGMVAGQRGYSFAVATAGGTWVETCRDGACVEPVIVPSDFKSLALDLPTLAYYVLTADGLRTCTWSGGCPADATPTPAATSLIAALPGEYFLLDSNGQASNRAGSQNLGSAAVPNPTKLMVVDGNGQTAAPVGTWSNGSALAQSLLTPDATATTLDEACTDFDVDATGRPLYCLEGSSSIHVIP